MDTKIMIKNLSKNYGKKQALKNVDLTIRQGMFGLLGPNGAGKTTLVKLLKGLLKPVSGSILFGNEDISERTVAQLAGSVGYVFQNPDDQIFKNRVMDEVMVGPLNIGMSREAAEKRAREALSMVGLLDAAEENPYDLDLSERKMVAIRLGCGHGYTGSDSG